MNANGRGSLERVAPGTKVLRKHWATFQTGKAGDTSAVVTSRSKGEGAGARGLVATR